MEDTHYTPTLHNPIPMGTKVKIPDHYLKEKGVTGVVAGISSIHVIFIYTVILDREVSSTYGNIRVLCVPGTELEGLDGENWRIASL